MKQMEKPINPQSENFSTSFWNRKIRSWQIHFTMFLYSLQTENGFYIFKWLKIIKIKIFLWHMKTIWDFKNQGPYIKFYWNTTMFFLFILSIAAFLTSKLKFQEILPISPSHICLYVHRYVCVCMRLYIFKICYSRNTKNVLWYRIPINLEF